VSSEWGWRKWKELGMPEPIEVFRQYRWKVRKGESTEPPSLLPSLSHLIKPILSSGYVCHKWAAVLVFRGSTQPAHKDG
jgi:hypothetical protein